VGGLAYSSFVKVLAQYHSFKSHKLTIASVLPTAIYLGEKLSVICVAQLFRPVLPASRIHINAKARGRVGYHTMIQLERRHLVCAYCTIAQENKQKLAGVAEFELIYLDQSVLFSFLIAS
jgi:hypothetical protein